MAQLSVSLDAAEETARDAREGRWISVEEVRREPQVTRQALAHGRWPNYATGRLAAIGVLDEVDRLLESLPVPTVTQRLNPDEVVHDSAREAGGVPHYLFITTALDVGARLMRVTRVGHYRPA